MLMFLHERQNRVIDLFELEQESIMTIGGLDHDHFGIVQKLGQLVLLRDRKETIGLDT